LYRGIATAPGSTVVVAVERNEVVGFAAATVDTPAMYRHVIRRHWLRLALAAAPHAFGIRPLRYVWETMRYPKQSSAHHDHADTPAELLSIGVDRTRRGTGIGRALIDALEGFFRDHGEERYKVVTAADDDQSNAFYRARGFAPVREFEHHGRTMREYQKETGTNARKQSHT